MAHLMGLMQKHAAEDMAEAALSSSTILGKVASALHVDTLEKRAFFMRAPRMKIGGGESVVDFLTGSSPFMNALERYINDHPPLNMDAMRDLYGQATEKALQSFVSKIETGDDADPMGLALKNLHRMADILGTRLEIMKAQKEIAEYQKEVATQQGLSEENPAAAAAQQLPAPAAPPPMEAPAPPEPAPAPAGPPPAPAGGPPPGAPPAA